MVPRQKVNLYGGNCTVPDPLLQEEVLAGGSDYGVLFCPIVPGLKN